MSDELDAIVPIPFRPDYGVSRNGTIWTTRHTGQTKNGDQWRVLSPAKSKTGHLRVCLCKGGKKINAWVHRIVLQTFVGQCPEGMEGCHNDGNPANNSLDNLRWAKHADNIADKQKHGTVARGERHGQARLSDSEVRKIRELYATGNFKQRDLASMFGVVQATIYYIVNRKTRTNI